MCKKYLISCIHSLPFRKRFFSNANLIMKSTADSYQQAISALNGLQSNEEYLRNVRDNKTNGVHQFLQFQKYLNRSEVKQSELDKLSVIHVAGTKGKGTTCAICENILRKHGYKTGFFSSPHLLQVRERIRINGRPIDEQKFTKHFWNVYRNCESHKENPTDMPKYFALLTLLAFDVFVKEQVDVAVLEVGIGGELDCTNVVRNPDVVGITSLGIDHTPILGKTLEQIAWQKAGIMKEGCSAFAAPQAASALLVLRERAMEKNCTLKVVEPFVSDFQNLHMPPEIFAVNASLAVAMAEAWMFKKNRQPLDLQITKNAVESTSWPGRFQIINKNNTKFFLDGAHTMESFEICLNWFLQNCSRDKSNHKVLVFNLTGDREPEQFLKLAIACRFHRVYFTPNRSFSSDITSDSDNYSNGNKSMVRCHQHQKIWKSLEEQTAGMTKCEKVTVHSNVQQVFEDIYKEDLLKLNVLVTGSIHLVGAAIGVLENNKNIS